MFQIVPPHSSETVSQCGPHYGTVTTSVGGAVAKFLPTESGQGEGEGLASKVEGVP